MKKIIFLFIVVLPSNVFAETIFFEETSELTLAHLMQIFVFGVAVFLVIKLIVKVGLRMFGGKRNKDSRENEEEITFI